MLRCSFVASFVETTVVSETTTFSVETIAFSVETIAFSVETIAFPVETSAFSVETSAFSVETTDESSIVESTSPLPPPRPSSLGSYETGLAAFFVVVSTSCSVSFTRVSVLFVMMIAGVTVVVIVELTESGFKSRAITSVLLAPVVRADVLSGNLVADVFSMIVVLVVVVVVVELVGITEDLVVVEVVVDVFVAGKATGSATDFALLVLMLEETVVVEVVVVEVVMLVVEVVDGDASTFFSSSAAGAGATFAGDAFFFTT